MHIGLIGATFWGNRGAEAMLSTSIGMLRQRYPNAQFYVFSYYPKKDCQLVHDSSVTVLDARPLALVLLHFPFCLAHWCLSKVGVSLPQLLTPKVARVLRDLDVLVDLGGISFADGREVFLPFDVLCIWPAMLCFVPVVKLSQAMGPFESWSTRFCAKYFLGRCDCVVARGPDTFSYLRELGLAGDRIRMAADVAFCFEPSFRLTHENEDRVNLVTSKLEHFRDSGKQVIGISPSTVVQRFFSKHGRDYVEFLAEWLRELIHSGAALVVFPNATREGESQSKNNDLIVIDELRRHINRRWQSEELASIEWVNFDVDTASVRRVTALCRMVVTSRFHAMVASLCTNTPVVVVGWSHKYAEVLHMFGLADFAVDSSTTSSELSTLIRKGLEDNGYLRQVIRETLPLVRDGSSSQFDLVAKAVA